MDTQTKDTRSHILDVGRRLTAHHGFAGVGLSELLKAANVPKGSFYHYFKSKEAYGCALLEEFVIQYRASLDQTLANNGQPARDRILGYFEGWAANQSGPSLQDRCLVVKLSAEVADLSSDMSGILQDGVTSIISSLQKTLEQGMADGSIARIEDPHNLAQSIYHMWLGASLVAALSRDDSPLDAAMNFTLKAVPAA